MRKRKYVPFSKASKLFPGRPHISTVRRWAQRGVRGIRLQTVMSGGRLYVEPQAAERFLSEVTAAASKTLAPKDSVGQTTRDIARVEAELAKDGI